MNIRYWLWIQFASLKKKKRARDVSRLKVTQELADLDIAWVSTRAQILESLNMLYEYLNCDSTK